MPIIINELHTDLTEPTAAEALEDPTVAPEPEPAPAALEPELALQRAVALLAERQARLRDD